MARHRRADGGAGDVLTARYFVTSFRCHRNRTIQCHARTCSDHQKLAQARAEIARLRKAAEAKAEPLTDTTRRKLEGELMKVKLENDRLREQLAAGLRQRRRARSRSCASKSRC